MAKLEVGRNNLQTYCMENNLEYLLDEQQTIYTGGIHTTAVSTSTRSHLMEATEGQWMVDTIYYSGFKKSPSFSQLFPNF